MGVSRSALQGAHCHADIIYFRPQPLNKEESKDLLVLRVKPTLTRFPPNIQYTPVVGTPLNSIANVLLRLQRQVPTGG